MTDTTRTDIDSHRLRGGTLCVGDRQGRRRHAGEGVTVLEVLASRAVLLYRLITATVVLTGAAILLAGAAAADPNQDDRFLALLNEQNIPALKNKPTLIAVAHKVCRRLDSGMPVGDLVDEMREKSYNAFPVERLLPPDRVTRTEIRFIIAAVQAYCPNHQSEIVSIMANPVPGSYRPTHPAAVYTHNAVNSARDSRKPPSALDMINMAAASQTSAGTARMRLAPLMNGGGLVAGRYTRSDHDSHGGTLAPLIRAVPAGEIVPNPPQIPVQPPSAQIETPSPPIAAPPARNRCSLLLVLSRGVLLAVAAVVAPAVTGPVATASAVQRSHPCRRALSGSHHRQTSLIPSARGGRTGNTLVVNSIRPVARVDQKRNDR